MAESIFPMDSMSPSPSPEIPRLTVSPADTTLKLEDVPVDAPKPEKKPVKKRKSWGQELPTPKTNLPPRKRAKTEDEKEQRRIERVLRNRAAAQISRERKRLEIEKLEGEKLKIEQQNEFLLRRLSQMEEENSRLSQQVAKLASEIQSKSRPSSPSAPVSSSPGAAPSPTLTPVLFKQESDLSVPFPSVTSSTTPATTSIMTTTSLSPSVLAFDHTSAASPSDMTQHSAAVLCDLQCQSEGLAWTSKATSPSPSPSLTTMMIFTLCQTLTFSAYSTLIYPASLIFLSLRTGSPLTFSPAQMALLSPLILWLISPTATATTATTSTSTRSVFRSRLLTRLLACSPALARPLRDATSRELQLVLSEGSSGSLRSGSWEGLVTVLFAIDRLTLRKGGSRARKVVNQQPPKRRVMKRRSGRMY